MKIFKQLTWICVICLAGEGISRLLPFPFPASVVAMVILLILLFSGIVKTESVDTVADFLLQHMTFLFIPSGVAIMTTTDILQGHMAQMFLICIVTTVLVFAAAALTVQGVIALQSRWGKGRNRG